MGKVWGGTSLRHGFLAAATLVISLFSVSALASLEGNFSGSTTTAVSCGGPVFNGSPLSSTISLEATLSGSPGVSNVNITITSSDFTYTASGTALESGSLFFISTSSGSLVLTTSNSSINGSYPAGQNYNVNATLNNDGTLDFATGFVFYGSGSLCSGGNIQTDPFTALPSATGGAIDTSVTAGSTVAEAILFLTQIQGQVTDISRHITGAVGGGRHFLRPHVSDNQFMMEGATGLNAGDGSTIPYGFWGNYTYSDYDNDLSTTAFDGDSHSFLGGVDFAFWENTVLGVAFGYDNGDIDTTFNLGQIDTDTYTIAPYFGALLTDTLSIDFNVGYSRVEYDQFRTLPGTTTRVTSSPDADRWFGALNLNGVTYYDNWILGARVNNTTAK